MLYVTIRFVLLFSAPQDNSQTFRHNNRVLKTITTTYLGYELVDNWMGRYKLHTDLKNWFDAQEVCEQEGANLLVINSHKEAKAMLTLLEKTSTKRNYYWIGFHSLYEEGNYITIFSKYFNVKVWLKFGSKLYRW